jgi:hypothetical protein
MEFFDPSLPVIGSAGNKTSDDVTGIFGITGGGNPILQLILQPDTASFSSKDICQVEGLYEDQK